VRSADAEFLVQPVRSPHRAQAVFYVHANDRNRMTAGDDLGNGTAQSTQGVVVLGGDDTAGVAGGLQDRLFIPGKSASLPTG